MVNSMTGFGRAQQTLHGREITVELRSVNHRFLEIGVRAPRSCAFVEDRIKPVLQARIARGKVDVGVSIVNSGRTDERIEPNLALAREYAQAVALLADELGLDGALSAVTLSRFPDVFTVRRETPDEEELWADVGAVLGAALERYCAMRASEGARMEADLLARLDNIERAVGEVEAQSGERLERCRERLGERMRAVLADTDIDENRILLEAAIYADRSAVDEETVRLRSHLAQFREILRAQEPVGRKLDFLLQEINRETNTIGSKANDLEIINTVVEIKAEVEKLREQVQNIE